MRARRTGRQRPVADDVHAFAGTTCRDPRHLLRRQDRCGVRPRRLGAGELSCAEGRRRGGDRRRRRRGQSGEGGAGRLHHRRFAQGVVGEFCRAGADARRAADPSGAALVGAGRARGRRRGDRRHRTVLPRAPPSRAGCAVRRHHRHQRQVDHHGAGRASDAGGRLRYADGRQYRHRDPVAGAAARRPRPCHRNVVVPDRSCAIARSQRRHPAQYQRRPYRPPRHASNIMPRSRSGWSPACSRRAPRSSASTTDGAARSPTASSSPASAWCASR